ncbi:MAG: chromosome segregation protein SMC [Clostridia bacterium]|nr:chromosome segregation protein SMC [Clostridia bacterium]
MFLKYLEVCGFKSFPERVKIEFNKGITGIVGPNGSGKSNISDAIRWVMGEQSIKSLRGGKMEDVIFSGTVERKPVGFAEVSLCFDNSEKVFKIEYDEVLITRRYFRSGESEYYINKTSCRLRDIHELLMDTGMGRDGYSVVGQGKIDEIISAKPEDRRVIFEEAAGISKFKYRKQESEKKMQQTEENLVRLLDLISEIETRIEPLKEQSEKAKEFLRLRDELKGIEINLLVNSIDRLKSQLEKSQQDLKTNGDDINVTNQRIAEYEKQSEEFKVSSEEKELTQQESLKRLYEIKNEIAALENNIIVLENSRSFSNENRTRLENDINELSGENDELIKQTDIKNSELKALKLKSESLELEKKALDENYNKLENQVGEDATFIEKYNADIVSAYQSLSEVNLLLASKKSEINLLESKVVDFNDDIELKREDAEIYSKKADSEKRVLEQLKNDKKSLESTIDLKQNEIDECNKNLTHLNNILNDVTLSLNKVVSEKKMLEDLERDMEGYAHSVKAVIKEHSTGKLSHIKIYGTLSKLLKVPAEYAVAIETALGNNLQNIVTEDEEDAKRAIEYLKETKGGRATFVPVKAVKGKKLDDSEFKKLNGYIGLACDLVNFDEKFEKVVHDQLGRIIVIDSIDNAISFARNTGAKYKLVTIQGEVFNTGGSITGGSVNKNISFLSRGAKISDLAEKIKEQSKRHEKLSLDKANAEQVIELKNTEKHDLQTKLSVINNEIYKSEYNYENYLKTASLYNEEILKANQELKTSRELIKQYKAKCEEYENSQKGINDTILELKSKIENIQEQNTENSDKVRRLSSEIMRLTIEISETENDISLASQEILTFELKIKANNEEIQKKQAEIDGSGGKDSEIDEKILAIRQEIENKNVEITQTEQQIEQIKIERNDISLKLTNISGQIKSLNENLVFLAKEQTRIEEKINKQNSDIDGINQRLWDDYELTYISASEHKTEIENFSETQKKVNSIKSSIKALGNVNVGAIDEYAQTKERYDFLTAQRDDLINAKETLKGVITDIENLMTKQFKSQLEIINKTFSKVFKELFMGGTAELVLTDEQNVLSAGVEIHAQPPGKKLQNMTLFSGGEKAIIAIALLFSLLEVRPSPVCVFDEIEAALDDVNVLRFAEYLKKMCLRSQFAIITHRRGTMEVCDTLYGVTMQQKGVSKLLKLNIDEVEENVLKNVN